MTTAGHNSRLTEPEKQALWGHHVRRRLAHKQELDVLKAEGKKLDSDAKNDGFSKAELDDFIDLMTTSDQQKKIEKFNMLKRNRIRLGLIHDDRKGDLLSDRVTSLEMIFAAGVESGLAALDRVSKQNAGSDEDRAFLDGYDEGQKILRENIQAAMEKSLASRSKEEPPEDDPFAQGQE